MLHIATSHADSTRWAEIQLGALQEHIRVPYTTWTSLPRRRGSLPGRFDHVIEQKGPLSWRLNHLAVEIAGVAREEDLLMFLAPDAFPIADPMPAVESALEGAALLAARRAGNAGDPQPYPCFCVTTVGAWRRLPGDWTDGPPWTTSDGARATDLGANLLRRLEMTGTPWVALERSDPARLDPVFFAVYGGIVYHHGAGLLTREHRLRAPRPLPGAGLPGISRLSAERALLWERREQRRVRLSSERLYERIAAGAGGWLAELEGT